MTGDVISILVAGFIFVCGVGAVILYASYRFLKWLAFRNAKELLKEINDDSTNW